MDGRNATPPDSKPMCTRAAAPTALRVKPAPIVLSGSLLFTFLNLSGCSALPEERVASLPEIMRGDTQALTDYPTPELGGSWVGVDFPEPANNLKQNGDSFTFTRTGLYREIPVDENYQGSLEGRAVKVVYEAKYQGLLRPVEGECFGSVSKDSAIPALSCNDGRRALIR
jgi:hypothetical protein